MSPIERKNGFEKVGGGLCGSVTSNAEREREVQLCIQMGHYFMRQLSSHSPQRCPPFMEIE